MMERKTEEQIQWAHRVKPHTIQRLYELDAKGILDENLIDEVGFGLLARCDSIHRVTHRLCPECGSEMEGAWDDSKYRKISCKSCQWHSTWIAYHRSYKRKRIHGGRAFEFFEAYLKSFPKCKNFRQKMLVIDRLIHEVHESTDMLWTSPAASNLIQGKECQIAELLDELAYGENIPEERKKIREEYFKKMKGSEEWTKMQIAKKNEEASKSLQG